MRTLFLGSMIAATAMCCAARADVGVTEIPGGLKTTVGENDITLQFYTPGTLRVTKTPVGAPAPEPSLAVIAEPADVNARVVRRGGQVELRGDKLSARLDLRTGELTFYNAAGRRLTGEKGAPEFKPVTDGGQPSTSARQAFALDKDEAIYGLGNTESEIISQRNVHRLLQPQNVGDGIPVFVSVKGYGIYWDNYSPTLFSDTPEATAFESQVGRSVDYYVMAADRADGVIAEMREISGRVPMFPLWTYGFWQSRERYKSQREICEVVDKHRSLGVPLDGIIQDWQYWGNNYLWNAMEFMSPDFRDPQMMVDSIHAMNAHAIISIWSSFGPQTKPYRELSAKGLLFDFSTWPQSGLAEFWPPRMDYPSGVKAYNPYSSEARDIYWKHLRRLYDAGIDGWWMDSTEPDFFDQTDADMDSPTGMGTLRKMRGAYPLLTVGGVHDHQLQADTTRRVFILTRSGWFGQQRYGCNVWTGDTFSTWENLRRAIPTMLNFSMTGNPNTNSDLGGFFAGAYNEKPGDNSAVDNPLFRELYVRWFQTGVFTPMMRSHGTDIEREIYNFGSAGEPVYDAIAEAIRLRYRLLPYIYSTAWMVTDGDYSFMRPLMMDFPADKAGWNRADEYMFGPALLVAPVLEAQYTPEKITEGDENTGWNRDTAADSSEKAMQVDFMAPRTAEVYLPAGTDWFDFFSGKRYRGGVTVDVPTTLKTIPLYARAGAIIPIGPDVQYASEKPWDSIEIRVYPGADGEFTLYEDEFDNYNYEKGAYSTITFRWNDRSRTLSVSDRSGSYPGMLAERRFKLQLMGDKAAEATIHYDGKAQSVRL